MIFDARKNLLKTLAGIDSNISSSIVNLSDLYVEKMEINIKEHNLKEQFKETTERMIQQMEITSKRLVDNVIKNAVKEVQNKKSEKKLPSLSEAIIKNDNSSKKIKSLHKKIFLSPSKIRSERIAKDNPYYK